MISQRVILWLRTLQKWINPLTSRKIRTKWFLTKSKIQVQVTWNYRKSWVRVCRNQRQDLSWRRVKANKKGSGHQNLRNHLALKRQKPPLGDQENLDLANLVHLIIQALRVGPPVKRNFTSLALLKILKKRQVFIENRKKELELWRIIKSQRRKKRKAYKYQNGLKECPCAYSFYSISGSKCHWYSAQLCIGGVGPSSMKLSAISVRETQTQSWIARTIGIVILNLLVLSTMINRIS